MAFASGSSLETAYLNIGGSRYGDNFILAAHPNGAAVAAYEFRSDGMGGEDLSYKVVSDSGSGGSGGIVETWYELPAALHTLLLTIWPPVDVDTDSDNDGQVDQDYSEELVEALANEPGKIMLVNGDDDNGDGEADKDEVTAFGHPTVFAADDDDLTEVALDYGLSSYEGLDGYTLELTCSDGLRIWGDKRRNIPSGNSGYNLERTSYTWDITGATTTDPFPNQVYVEGIDSGRETLTWTLRDPQDAAVMSDTVVFSVIELDIKIKGGNSVANGTTDVMVGQKMSLEGVVDSAGLDVTSTEWTIPGTRIKNYTQAQAQGVVTPLGPADLQGYEVNYYWIAAGNDLDVEFEVVVAGITLNVDARFDVLRPTATLTSVTTTDTPPVDVRSYPLGGDMLEFGHRELGTMPGIRWTGELTTGSNWGSGRFVLLQLIKTDRRQTLDDGQSTEKQLTSNGEFVLDDGVGVHYADTWIENNETKQLVADDSPGVELKATETANSADDQFELYLMYRPNGIESIFVTLRKLEWHWNGTATKDGQGVWSLGPEQSSSDDPTGVESSVLPEWDEHFTNLGYE